MGSGTAEAKEDCVALQDPVRSRRGTEAGYEEASQEGNRRRRTEWSTVCIDTKVP